MTYATSPANAEDGSWRGVSMGNGLNSSSKADQGWNYDLTGTVNRSNANDRWVMFWSAGGDAGGDHDGGNGGHVNITLNGTLVGGDLYTSIPDVHNHSDNGKQTITLRRDWARFSTVTVTPMVQLLSAGGRGGDGHSWRGPGGDGGWVALTQNGTISTSGNNYSGIWVTSAGERSGWGASDNDRARYLDSHGAGGSAVVTLSASASVSTKGNNAPGVVAESIGGDGGGNWSDAVVWKKWPSVGGSSGPVTITNNGRITTGGDSSPGIIAQSLAGKGSQQSPGGDTEAHNGGEGGNAGKVTVTNESIVTTAGSHSYGIVAYSVGGLGATGSQPPVFGSGGNGGKGGTAGEIKVANHANGVITTSGTGAYGIYALSAGGGLAAGYFNPHASDPGNGNGGDAAIWGKGGEGSAGGASGTVTVYNDGRISTAGNDATGIMAQSIGGGGGDGGGATKKGVFAAVALGGTGGTGGRAGSVTIGKSSSSVGKIATTGEAAQGIVAQSIGGGGGRGGIAKASSIGVGGSVSVAIGGTGGGGVAGGWATVNNTSIIYTAGLGAHAIQVQSIGGGGGMAGSGKAASLAIGVGDVPVGIAATVSIGGDGGSGGAGGTVTVTNENTIQTLGANAHGIFAQSIGGGGGDGGGATSYAISTAEYAAGVSVGIGGGGGSAGAGGHVTVTNSNHIDTYGEGSIGIFAQSIGGGGGAGGDATARADIYSLAKVEGLGVDVAIGGKGAAASNGGAADVNNNSGASIVTRGSYAYGIMAQSIGGGGGKGGHADSAAGTGIIFGDTVSNWLEDTRLGQVASANVSLGGHGGGGGAAGAVSVTNAGRILTYGANSFGVYAQSVGGGGGDAGGFHAGNKGQINVHVGVGATGGSGGNAGDVTITNAAGGDIHTTGGGAHGIFAQSIGGGGGVGGTLTAEQDAERDLAVLFMGEVKKIVHYDDVKAWADQHGYTTDAQTLKGLADKVKSTGVLDPTFEKLKNSSLVTNYNKVKDGFEKAMEKPKSELPSISVGVNVGGSGGSGGTAGKVTLSNASSITTEGNIAYGIFAQSVGGGGGVGGGVGAGELPDKSKNEYNANINLGGSGSGASNGNAVTVTNNAGAHITTKGDASFGIFAQSIGGGGGVAGGATSPETTKFTANVAVGGNGGSAGSGNTVTVTNNGNIQTLGKESHALVAQSIGGGGGAAAINLGDGDKDAAADAQKTEENKSIVDQIKTVISKAGALFPSKASEQKAEEQKKETEEAGKSENKLEKYSFTLALGGKGGKGGDGGTVNVTHTGSINTTDEASFGIMAQSIGGGGGLFSTTGAFDKNHGRAYTLGGKDGANGNGGTVNVTLGGAASIVTAGNGAHAIFAQSIGGGGGYAGRVTNDMVLFSSKQSTGNGGHVSITTAPNVKASIVTTGKGAAGIFAQSLGGGGGYWTNTDNFTIPYIHVNLKSRTVGSGKGGQIDINYNGSIHATGENSYVILAQSGVQDGAGAIDPASTGGNVNITLSGGNFRGGSGEGAVIRVDGGNTNTITIQKDAVLSATSGNAILSSFGNDTVNIYGHVTGNIDLTKNAAAAGDNHIVVSETGYLQTVDNGVINVGAGWFDVMHGGTLNIGGTGHVSAANVTGNVNLDGAKLMVDVDVNPTTGARLHDTLNVSGALYHYSISRLYDPGQIVVNVINGLVGGDYDIFNKTPRNNNLRVVSSNASAASPIAWTISKGGQSIRPVATFVNTANKDFTPTASEISLLTGLQQQFDNGDFTHAQLFGHFAKDIHTAADYQTAVRTLSPEDYQSVSGAQTHAASTSLGASLSCPVFIDGGVTLGETECVWARVSGSRTDQDGARHTHGYKQDQFTYRVGGQKEVSPGWFVGATAAYFSNEITSKNNAHVKSQGEGGDISISVKRQIGSWLLSASGHLGYGSYDTSHRISVANRTWFNSANQDVWTVGGRLRAAYELALGNFYIRPHLDLDVVHTYAPSFMSHGNFLHAYHFNAMKEWTLSASPTVEIGTRINIDDKTWLRPYASIGATFLHDSELKTTGVLGLGGASFTATHKMDDQFLDLGAGLQFFSNEQLELRAEYKAKIGENYIRHDAIGRMSVKF